jgi:two-component system sensor histidine kinase RegB
VFYLVHVALAALLLSGRWTWAIASLSTACFAILFAAQDPHAMHHGHGDFSIHLRGMLLSYAIAAGSIGFFVSWLKRSLAQRESQLAELDAMRTRSEQVVGLSALAAGAAHELGSPLGTIALIAKEMEHALAREADSAQLTDQRVATLDRLREDAALLRSEVDRCRAILATMGDRAGEPQVDDAEQVATSAITDAVREALGPRRAERLRIKGADATHVRASQRPLVQALVSLVANGLDASPDTEPVELEVVRDNGEVRFVVTDRGGGMPPETLARIGEPFFTTKPKSRGFGLGLFLVRSFAERSRARLEVSSTPGSGTQVTLSMASES